VFEHESTKIQKTAILDDGYTQLKAVVSPSQIADLAESVRAYFHELLDAAGGRSSLSVGVPQGYREIVHRSPGRYDLQLAPSCINAFPLGLDGVDRAPWSSLITDLLGKEAKLLMHGALVALPGASGFSWHSDGRHLFDYLGDEKPHVHLPPYCINIFVPLTLLSEQSGLLEFCPGSHHLTGVSSEIIWASPQNLEIIGAKEPTRVVGCQLGDALAFEYRVLHRAMPNRSEQLRMIFYATYAAYWYIDALNFPPRSVFKGTSNDSST